MARGEDKGKGPRHLFPSRRRKGGGRRPRSSGAKTSREVQPAPALGDRHKTGGPGGGEGLRLEWRGLLWRRRRTPAPAWGLRGRRAEGEALALAQGLQERKEMREESEKWVSSVLLACIPVLPGQVLHALEQPQEGQDLKKASPPSSFFLALAFFALSFLFFCPVALLREKCGHKKAKKDEKFTF